MRGLGGILSEELYDILNWSKLCIGGTLEDLELLGGLIGVAEAMAGCGEVDGGGDIRERKEYYISCVSDASFGNDLVPCERTVCDDLVWESVEIHLYGQ